MKIVKWLVPLVCGMGFWGTIIAETEEDTTTTKPEYTLEGVLVTASRIAESPMKLPLQITVIEEEEIGMHGVSGFGDLSYLIPTSNLSHRGYLGSVSTLSMRNATGDQILFLLDGRPMNDPQNGILNLATVPLPMLNRIEIMRGGASSLWGANAIGGVVNLTTKRFGQGLPYSKIALRRGGQNTSISAVEFGRRMGKRISFFVSSELKKSDGFRNNSDYDGTNIGGNLNCCISPLWEARMGIRRYEGKLGVPGDTLFPTPGAREDDYRIDADLKLNRMVPGSETEIQLFGSDIWNTYTDVDFQYCETNRSRLSGFQLEQKLRLFDRHKLNLGGYGERIVAELKGEEHRTHLLSGFVQIELCLGDWANLFVSARLDSHSVYGYEFSPSIGATLPLRDEYAVYLNWNRSFRAPTLNELYYPGYGNPDLDPERSTGIESGLKMESSLLHGSIACFRRRVKDMIQPGVGWIPYNVGEANIEGVELDLRVSPMNVLSVGFNCAISEALDDLDHELIYQPGMKAGGYVEIGRTFKENKLENRVLVSGEFVGKRLSETAKELPGYYLLHVKFLWRILDLTAFLRFENVLDSGYEVRQGYPMPERNHIFGLEWEFWD